jgi:hypothetical protein
MPILARLVQILFLALVLAVPSVVHAEKLLAAPPPSGALRAGQRVLVDDHTCPPGQVKEITGGSNASVKDGTTLPGTSRQIRCIPH